MRITILILFLFLPLASADVISVSSYSSNNTVILSNPYIEGFFFGIIPSTNILSDGRSGGNIIPFYDLFVDVEEQRISNKPIPISLIEIKGGKIHTTIIIINQGDYPDKDAVLSQYFINPKNVSVLINRQTFIEVVPTCRIGRYDKEKRLCITATGTEIAKEFVINNTYDLSPEFFPGLWTYEVTYETQNQPLITSKDTFTIYKQQNIYPIILILLFLVIWIIFYTQKTLPKNNK